MTKANILIVEDEHDLASAYQIILEKSGYDVSVANDGMQALQMLEDCEPELILLDLRMPRVSGIEFLKKYQLLDKHPNVKVIVFSNLDADKEIDEAYTLGATKYMLKALASPNDLAKLVAETLADRD